MNLLVALEESGKKMGNCVTKPKARGGDDAPPPAEPQTPARAVEGENKDVETPAVEEKSEVR